MIEFDTIIPEEEENTTPGFDPNFHIKDDSMAEWAVRQKLDAEAEKAKWKAYYKDALDKINASCDATIANMTRYLNEYFGKVPHKKTDKQESYRLPSGKLVLKRQECDFERDDEEIIKWLKANNGDKFIKTKESLDWDGLKKTLSVMGETVADSNGEIIPGIKAIERPDVFKIEK